MFIDIVASTQLALTKQAEEVVALFNAFFAVIVDVVGEHGGWVNKFEGDAALCIFGAPLPIDDAEGSALQAARLLGARLRREMQEVSCGIGVAAGTVVAGNIGAPERFEYKVIGDPGNEAARLSEVAEQSDGHILADRDVVARARDEERSQWSIRGEVALRGRSSKVTVAVPATDRVNAERGAERS